MRLIDADVINALKSQGYKAKSGSTLRYWKKSELIEQINILEHNWGCEIIAHNRGVKYAEGLLKKQGWHYPSKGDLPTEDGLYFVACTSTFEGGDNYTDFCHYKAEQERWINFFGHTNPNVYAWMPLPLPPKENEK